MRSPRAWFYELLSRGAPETVDEDEVVEAGYVPLVSAPLVLARLREAGLQASGAETRANPYGGTSMCRIFCRRGDLTEAQAIIDDVTSR